MTRGSLAPLSANEETTLRRVALGITKAAHLPKRDVERLTTLRLVEEHNGGLRLKPLGRERYLALSKGVALEDADSPDAFLTKLADFMAKARG